MWADFSEPVLGIAEITFPAVHDAMPETSIATGQVLAQIMTAFQITRHKPQTGQTQSRLRF